MEELTGVNDPMNEQKPVAVILGGIYPHGFLMRKLKARGYYTVLVDYFDAPPAAADADEHIKESAMDYDAVLKIAKEKNAELVMSPCLDQQMLIAARVSETLGLSFPFDPETARNVTNKRYMKKIMMENGIPTAKYIQVGKDTDLSSLGLRFPVIVKPVDSCGSAGVARIEDPALLAEAVKRAGGWSFSNDVIIEEYRQGREVSVYSYVRDKKAVVVTTQNRISFVGSDIVKCFSSVCPADVSAQVKEKLGEVATRIAQVFGFDNTPLFYQAIVGEDGEVSVIEFSPRLGGGTCFYLMEDNADFDMLSASIDSYHHIRFDKDPVPEKKTILAYQVQGMEGVYDHTEGLEEQKSKGLIAEYFMQKTSGMHISTEKASSARVIALIIKGDDRMECLGKLREAMKGIRIIDNEGRDITDRRLIPAEGDIV